MKKIFTVLILSAFAFTGKAQLIPDYSDLYGEGFAVVEGKVHNISSGSSSIEFIVQGYIEQSEYFVPIEADGTFQLEYPVEDVQDVLFALDGTPFSFVTWKGNRTRIEFDDNDPLGTLRMTGDSDERTKELELYVLLAKNRELPRMLAEARAGRGTIQLPERLERYNRYYNTVIGIIDDYEAQHGKLRFAWKLRADTYFEVCNSLLSITSDPRASDGINGGEFNAFVDYRKIDNNLFKVSPTYRYYLHRIIFMSGFYPFATSGFAAEDNAMISQLFSDYYFALSKLDIAPIRDWYITERALMHIPDSDPEEIRRFLDDFRKICRNDRYMALLEANYATVANLYDNAIAPQFTLKDENGKTVSLSDFRGRIVYLDFWDSYCGACIAQFQNYDKNFHEKYAAHDIVHIYICFSSDPARWKQDIERYDLQGVNLITESRKDNPIYKDYALYGFPHYVLIGRDGKIVKNGCETPREMLNDNNNSLTRLLQSE